MNKRDFQMGDNSSGHKTNPAANRKRILVVDDDSAVRTALTEVLAGEGYLAVPAGGGLQAVALAASTPPDLVLLDINLLGQSGWDTFETLASAHPVLPIIIITAKPGQYAQATRLRADALMEKPLDLPLLLEAIGKLLAEPEAQRTRRRNAPAFKPCYLKEMARKWPGAGVPRNRDAPSDDQPAHESPGEKTSQVTESKRILVVDDDSAVRQMLRRILTNEGYLVGEAANGVQALEIVAKEPFHLMLLDLNMPMKSGWDTFERLTTENPFLPVMIITARPNQLFTSLGAGVAALMEKPLDFPKLLQTISVLLAEGPEVQLARMAGRRAEFYYQPAGRKGASHEKQRPRHGLARGSF
jgi:CheY-like chemotaxis protein